MPTHELDVAAVQQDATIIHDLASRSGDMHDHEDPVVRALAAWVEFVDAGVDDATSFVMTTPDGAGAHQAGRGRRAMLVAGSTALALVVSGGAAAAVTGDPLAVVKAPFQVLSKANPFNDGETNARDQLPEQTPTRAQANKLLADARRAMAQGNTEKAQRLLAEAKDLLGDDASRGQQKLIDTLDGKLPGPPGQTRDPGQGAQPGGKAGSADQGGQPGGKAGTSDQGAQPGGKAGTSDQGAQPGDKGSAPDQGDDGDLGDRGNSGVGSDSATGGPSSRGLSPTDEANQTSG
jgi:hypothetical protein